MHKVSWLRSHLLIQPASCICSHFDNINYYSYSIPFRSSSNSKKASQSVLLSEPQPIAGNGGSTFQFVCSGNGLHHPPRSELVPGCMAWFQTDQLVGLPPPPLPRYLLPAPSSSLLSSRVLWIISVFYTHNYNIGCRLHYTVLII